MSQISDIDFEGNGNNTPPSNQSQEEDVTNLHGDGDKTDLNSQTPPPANEGGNNNQTPPPANDNDNNNNEELEFNENDEIEVDGVVYHFDADKNLVDAEGKVFKNANEVKDWLKENDATEGNDNDSDFSIESIQNAVGIEIKDENGKAVEFTNDAAGVKSYIDSVMELRSKEISEATMNKFFTDAPIVKEFIDYVTLNGSPDGFGQLRDRSGITLDKDNEAQLESVIRMAAKEFGNKTINDNYIKYLKETGTLYDEANAMLQSLVEKDKAVKAELTQRAEQAREADRQRVVAYWKSVESVIASRNIAGYKIPDSFIIEKDGRKITQTPNDFMAYLSRQNKETGRTGYQTDLDNMSEDEVLNAELLDAWLHFTGKTYKDLINMAVKEDNVRRLVVKSKEHRNTRSVKINRKPGAKVNVNDIQLD